MNTENEATIEQIVWIKEENDVIDVKDSSDDDDVEEKLPIVVNSSLYPTYPCNICSKTFTNKYSLTRHVKIHVNPDKYECSTCGKCFNDKSNLNQHERIHTGEKRYNCNECNMKFTHKSSLRSHLITHTGLKEFACVHCGMRFARGHTMRKHIGRKHSEDNRKKEKRKILL